MAIHIKIKNKNLHIFPLTQKDQTHHKNEWQHKNGQYGYDVTYEYNNNGFEDLNLQIWHLIFYMCHLTELGNEWQENYTTYTNSLIAIDKFRVISILEISIFSLHLSPMVLRKSYWCVDEGCNSNDRKKRKYGKKWLDFVTRQDYVPKRSHRLCMKHFVEGRQTKQHPYHHDIAEILLKEELNTIKQTK